MAGLRWLRPDATFHGIGGEAMEAEGLRSRFLMSDLSVMGISEVLGRYRLLRNRLEDRDEGGARNPARRARHD
jgi:lipid-A-disaccharide synthase